VDLSKANEDIDDVVFFEDDAIASIAKRMVENPHYFAVSANSVNNPALSWVHYGLGVYEPYLPVSRNYVIDALPN